jgi:hypothetical protein
MHSCHRAHAGKKHFSGVALLSNPATVLGGGRDLDGVATDSRTGGSGVSA